jgi:hypothetical protein
VIRATGVATLQPVRTRIKSKVNISWVFILFLDPVLDMICFSSRLRREPLSNSSRNHALQQQETGFASLLRL